VELVGNYFMASNLQRLLIPYRSEKEEKRKNLEEDFSEEQVVEYHVRFYLVPVLVITKACGDHGKLMWISWWRNGIHDISMPCCPDWVIAVAHRMISSCVRLQGKQVGLISVWNI